MTTRHGSSSFRLLVCGLCLSLMLAVSGCSRETAPVPSGAPSAATPPPVTVDVVRVVAQPLDVPLSLTGELDAYESVALHARVTGFVRDVSVDRGSHVSKGAELVTLEAPELAAQRAEAFARMQAAESQVAVARAQSRAADATHARLVRASATPGVVAGQELTVSASAAEAGVSQLRTAEQQVDAARQALQALQQLEGYLRVTAPFAGVITERHVHPGALVGPAASGQMPLLRLVNLKRLRLVVPVPEAYTAALEQGMVVQFNVSAYPGEAFRGTVARIARTVDVATRTMAVELDVDNADGRLAPGAFCQVRWPVRRSEPSVFVPAASIASTTDRTFVIRIREGRTEWVDVTTGLTSGALVEIFGDVKAGDELAGRGTDALRPGTAVVSRAVPAAR